MISTKLLSEVMGYVNPCPMEVEDNKLYLYKELGENITTLNIYELAHECKEWSYTKGFRLQVQKYKELDYQCIIDEMNIEYHPAKYATTEPDAIFKACEWILKRIQERISL